MDGGGSGGGEPERRHGRGQRRRRRCGRVRRSRWGWGRWRRRERRRGRSDGGACQRAGPGSWLQHHTARSEREPGPVRRGRACRDPTTRSGLRPAAGQHGRQPVRRDRSPATALGPRGAGADGPAAGRGRRARRPRPPRWCRRRCPPDRYRLRGRYPSPGDGISSSRGWRPVRCSDRSRWPPARCGRPRRAGRASRARSPGRRRAWRATARTWTARCTSTASRPECGSTRSGTSTARARARSRSETRPMPRCSKRPGCRSGADGTLGGAGAAPSTAGDDQGAGSTPGAGTAPAGAGNGPRPGSSVAPTPPALGPAPAPEGAWVTPGGPATGGEQMGPVTPVPTSPPDSGSPPNEAGVDQGGYYEPSEFDEGAEPSLPVTSGGGAATSGQTDPNGSIEMEAHPNETEPLANPGDATGAAGAPGVPPSVPTPGARSAHLDGVGFGRDRPTRWPELNDVARPRTAGPRRSVPGGASDPRRDRCTPGCHGGSRCT